jgi:hypothetical protein
MCRWTETKFAEVFARLKTFQMSGRADTQQIEDLATVVEDITRQVAGELQDLDARLLHLETHLRQTGPARK